MVCSDFESRCVIRRCEAVAIESECGKPGAGVETRGELPQCLILSGASAVVLWSEWTEAGDRTGRGEERRQMMIDECSGRSCFGKHTTLSLTLEFGPIVHRDLQADCAEWHCDGDRDDEDNPEPQCRCGHGDAHPRCGQDAGYTLGRASKASHQKHEAVCRETDRSIRRGAVSRASIKRRGGTR